MMKKGVKREGEELSIGITLFPTSNDLNEKMEERKKERGGRKRKCSGGTRVGGRLGGLFGCRRA